MVRLDHDNRNEPAYGQFGRQPFGYMAIIRWARANGWPYRWRGRTLEVKCWPRSRRALLRGWVGMRAACARNFAALYGARLP